MNNNIDFLKAKLEEAQKNYDAVKRKRNTTHGTEKARLLRLLALAKGKYNTAVSQNGGPLPVAAAPVAQAAVPAAAPVVVSASVQSIPTAAAPAAAVQAMPTAAPPSVAVQAIPAAASPAVQAAVQAMSAAAPPAGTAAVQVPPIAVPAIGHPMGLGPVNVPTAVQAAFVPAATTVPAPALAAPAPPIAQLPTAGTQSQVQAAQTQTAAVHAVFHQGGQAQVSPTAPINTMPMALGQAIASNSAPPAQGSQVSTQFPAAQAPIGQGQPTQGIASPFLTQGHIAPTVVGTAPAVLVNGASIGPAANPVLNTPVIAGHADANLPNASGAQDSPQPAHSNLEGSIPAHCGQEISNSDINSPVPSSAHELDINSQNGGDLELTDNHVTTRVNLNGAHRESDAKDGTEDYYFTSKDNESIPSVLPNQQLFHNRQILQSSAQEVKSSHNSSNPDITKDHLSPATSGNLTNTTSVPDESSGTTRLSLINDSQDFGPPSPAYFPQSREDQSPSMNDNSHSSTAQMDQPQSAAPTTAESGFDPSSFLSSIHALSQDEPMLNDEAIPSPTTGNDYNEQTYSYGDITMEDLLTMANRVSMPSGDDEILNIFDVPSDTFNFTVSPPVPAPFSQTNFETLLGHGQNVPTYSTDPAEYMNPSTNSPITPATETDARGDCAPIHTDATDDIINLPRVWEAHQRVSYLKVNLTELTHSENQMEAEMEALGNRHRLGDITFKAMLGVTRPIEKSLEQVQARKASLSAEVDIWEEKLAMFIQHERNLRRQSSLRAENIQISRTVDGDIFVDPGVYYRLGQRREEILKELDEIAKQLKHSTTFVNEADDDLADPQTEHPSLEQGRTEEEISRKRKLAESDGDGDDDDGEGDDGEGDDGEDDESEGITSEEESADEQPPRKKGRTTRTSSKAPLVKATDDMDITEVAQYEGFDPAALDPDYKGRMPSSRLKFLAGKINAKEEELRPTRKKRSAAALAKAAERDARRPYQTKDLPANACPIPGITAGEFKELLREGSEQVRDFLKSGKMAALKGSIRRLAREYYEFLPETSNQTRELALAVHYTEQGTYKCRFHSRHRNRKEHDGPGHGENTIEGVGYKPDLRPRHPPDDHFHCGCSIEDVLLEFWWWKTWTAKSTNPSILEEEGMKSLEIFPRLRAFLCQNFRAYTRLSIDDIYVFAGLKGKPLWHFTARVQWERLGVELGKLESDIAISRREAGNVGGPSTSSGPESAARREQL